jgi:hypothetical protein
MGVSEWIAWASLGVLAWLLLCALALVVCRALALELSLGLGLVEVDCQSYPDDGPPYPDGRDVPTARQLRLLAEQEPRAR